MSVKYYGIYLAYPPTVDLSAEGLGRHLAAFLKGAAERTDVRFVIVCPSWSTKSIHVLCENESIPENSFDLYAPKGQNMFLILHEMYQNYKKQHKVKSKFKFFTYMRRILDIVLIKSNQRILVSRSLVKLFGNSTMSIPLFMINIFYMLYKLIKFTIKKISDYFAQQIRRVLCKPLKWLQEIAINPKNNIDLFYKFKIIEDHEIQLMLNIINNLPQISAWYTPTAFWPSFNSINAPKLMCVPDVVLTEFPVGFSKIGGDRFLDKFNMVEEAIRGGTHFVTYSQHTKEQTLMTRYGVKSNNIVVIPHAANRLDHLIYPHGCSDSEELVIRYCQQHLAAALKKADNHNYATVFNNTEIKFFFYASQFRPSKNIITLLKAYKFLLRNRFISHKLILTGSRGWIAQIDHFIDENHLGHDVILLHHLSLEELACCYKLADVVVNPSLSEGGCPFTFTESLSVDTPVIMARIPVTTQVITDSHLQDMMMFDPYSWQDLAERLEWAVAHKSILLNTQRQFYQYLVKRRWRHVVDEYIDTLNLISREECNLGVANHPEVSAV